MAYITARGKLRDFSFPDSAEYGEFVELNATVYNDGFIRHPYRITFIIGLSSVTLERNQWGYGTHTYEHGFLMPWAPQITVAVTVEHRENGDYIFDATESGKVVCSDYREGVTPDPLPEPPIPIPVPEFGKGGFIRFLLNLRPGIIVPKEGEERWRFWK